MKFLSHTLPSSTPPLSGGVPEPAPPGAIFVLGDALGWAVPPRVYTLHFGRAEADVHVPIGVHDSHISRQHGLIMGDGKGWWLENTGRLPIQLPDRSLLLRGHGTALPSGYTPLIINSQNQRSHLLQIRIVGFERPQAVDTTRIQTRPFGTFNLSKVEHLVVAALAQRYLRGERHAQPVTWKQAADTLNQVPGQRIWTARTVEGVVAAIRERLAIPYTRRNDEVPEPVGNTLSHNLIEALLTTATLLPEDLRSLAEDPDDLSGHDEA